MRNAFDLHLVPILKCTPPIIQNVHPYYKLCTPYCITYSAYYKVCMSVHNCQTPNFDTDHTTWFRQYRISHIDTRVNNKHEKITAQCDAGYIFTTRPSISHFKSLLLFSSTIYSSSLYLLYMYIYHSRPSAHLHWCRLHESLGHSGSVGWPWQQWWSRETKEW